jgi:protein SCO1/2
MPRTPLALLGVLVVAAIAVGGWLWYLGDQRAGETRVEMIQTGPVGIGGPFSLIDQNGVRRTDKDFQDKAKLVFFGFTYCPDVCPTSLALMSAVLERLGSDADRITPIMITVDPKRDTPEVLKAYLESFGPRFVGLTGTEAEIAAAARAFKVFYQPSAAGDGNFDHSSIIYLMNRDNEYVAHFALGTTVDEMARSVRERLAEAS